MKNYILPAFIFSLGIALGGYFIGNGFIKSKYFDQYVTVKGLSEREVKADLAIWPISFTIVSNDLVELERLLKEQTTIISEYLAEKGINETEISIGAPSINDLRANYYGGNNYNPFRYMAKGKITVQTTSIENINNAITEISDLLSKGIVIEQDEYRNKVDYQYTRLNEIKPDMIREATLNAREAAMKFAEDSGSKVGKIRKATQGYFSISDRDINSPHIKTVRVVTTIEYFLED